MKKKGSMTNEYDFTLFLEGPAEITRELEGALYEAGCSDGLLGRQNGVIFLDFTRRARSFREAVVSAVKQIEGTLPDVKVSGMEPSPFLTQSELARELNISREYIRLLASGDRRGGGFPSPVLSSEKRLFWSLPAVLKWYLSDTPNQPDIERAQDLWTIFFALEIRNNRAEYRRVLDLIRELDEGDS